MQALNIEKPLISNYETNKKKLSKFQAFTSLITAMLGSNLLIIASAFSHSGTIWSCVQLFVCGCFTFVSIHALVNSANNIGEYSYQAIVEKVYGTTGLIILNIMIFLVGWGTSILMLNLMVDLFSLLMSCFLSEESWLTQNSNGWLIFLVTTVFSLPLVLIKELKFLSNFFLLNFVLVAFFCVTVVVEYVKFQGTFESTVSFSLSGTDLTLPTAIFSYSCQLNSLEIFADLKKQNLSSIYQITTGSLLIVFGLCVFVGLMGYATFGIGSTQILTNTANSILLVAYGYTLDGDSQDLSTIVTVCVALTIFSLVIAQPFEIRPAVDALLSALKSENSSFMRYILILVTVYSGMVVVIVFPDLSSIVGVVGSIFSPVVCFTYPSLLYISGPSKPRLKVAHYLTILSSIFFLVWSIVDYF